MASLGLIAVHFAKLDALLAADRGTEPHSSAWPRKAPGHVRAGTIAAKSGSVMRLASRSRPEAVSLADHSRLVVRSWTEKFFLSLELGESSNNSLSRCEAACRVRLARETVLVFPFRLFFFTRQLWLVETRASGCGRRQWTTAAGDSGARAGFDVFICFGRSSRRTILPLRREQLVSCLVFRWSRRRGERERTREGTAWLRRTGENMYQQLPPRQTAVGGARVARRNNNLFLLVCVELYATALS